jgi:hypothetical protein
LPRHHQLLTRVVADVGKRKTGNVERSLHQLVHTVLVRLHACEQFATDVEQRQSSKLVIDEIGCLGQLRIIVSAVNVDDPILYLTIIEHQDRQNPITRQRQKLHLSQRHLITSGHGDNTGHVGQVREQVGR